MSPAAAWYADPMDPTQERWFDGTGWTTRTQPGSASAADAEPVVPDETTAIDQIVGVDPQQETATEAAWTPKPVYEDEQVGAEQVEQSSDETEDGALDVPDEEPVAQPIAKPVSATKKPRPAKAPKPAKAVKDPSEAKSKSGLLIVLGVIFALVIGSLFFAPAALEMMSSADDEPVATEQAAPDSGDVLGDAVAGVPGLPLVDAANEIADGASDVTYADCNEVAAAGKAPIAIGTPGYSPLFDEDGNGIGCEL